MKVFKSKIGLELIIPLIIVFGTVLVLIGMERSKWFAFVIILPVILFMVHLFMTTFYVIHGNTLTIKSGFLFNVCIDINTIKKIAETNNPISSPAISLDRLEIKYGVFNSVIISPKNKKEFIEELTSINPQIEVKIKSQGFHIH